MEPLLYLSVVFEVVPNWVSHLVNRRPYSVILPTPRWRGSEGNGGQSDILSRVRKLDKNLVYGPWVSPWNR